MNCLNCGCDLMSDDRLFCDNNCPDETIDDLADDTDKRPDSYSSPAYNEWEDDQ